MESSNAGGHPPDRPYIPILLTPEQKQVLTDAMVEAVSGSIADRSTCGVFFAVVKDGPDGVRTERLRLVFHPRAAAALAIACGGQAEAALAAILGLDIQTFRVPFDSEDGGNEEPH